MSTFPGSPRLVKGAIIGLDPFNPLASVTVFQYNPETLTRTLQPRSPDSDGDRSEVLRLSGAPKESIKLDVEIDATDQLEKVDKVATQLGIHPQLSALEMLIYPKSLTVIRNTLALAFGTLEIIPTEAPLSLFIWGRKRILPVRMNDMSITEEAHDVNLNPIRAKVSLGLEVLSYDDFPVTHPGYALFLAHQVVKEAMAVVGSSRSISAVGGGIPL